MRLLQDQTTLWNSVLTGPVRLAVTSLTVAASGSVTIPTGANPLVMVTPGGTGASLVAPAVMPTHTPSSTAVSPMSGPTLPRMGDTYFVCNTTAHSVLFYQPNATTQVGYTGGTGAGTSLGAGGVALLTCKDPTSATDGWRVYQLV